MENIIKALLQADNDVVSKATLELQEAFKNPDTILVLCELVSNNPDPSIRQYAAVLLKKRLGKLRTYNTLSEEIKIVIRTGILNLLTTEPEKLVRNAILSLISVLVKHEFGKNKEWERNVLNFIFENIVSNDTVKSELAAETFSSLTDLAPHQFVDHLQTIFNMYSSALMSINQSSSGANNITYHILVGVANLVPYSFGLHHNLAEACYRDSIPYVLKALKSFADNQDTEKYINAFEILENLADENSKILTPHLKLIIEFCLEISKNSDVDEAIQVKSLTYVGWLVRMRKKQIIKLKLVDPILLALFELIATPGNEEDEEYFGSNDGSTTQTCATQTMDVLALNVPPKQLIPTLLSIIEKALQSDYPYHKKASFLCIAVIAEGCSEAICSKYMRLLLDSIKMGIVEANPLIRNAALFALGQFSEHLQPEISQYAEEILPILFQFLQQLINRIHAGEEPPHIDRIFYALETFCENLEDALLPYLPTLMERLLEALHPDNSVHLRELAFSCTTSCITAAKTAIEPYNQKILDIVKPYLIETNNDDICTLRPNCIDTLAALVRQMGRDQFLTIADNTMSIGLTLLNDNDPDLRRSCFNLFGAIASVVHEDFSQAPMENIVQAMITSVKSTEGVIATFTNDSIEAIETEAPNENEEIDLEQSDGEDEYENSEITGYNVENAYLEEKEEAILALMELAEQCGTAFQPYIQTSFEEIYKQINNPNEDIRASAIDALRQFIISFYKLNNISGATQTVTILIPKLSEIIRTDEDRQVVMRALEAFNDILKILKSVAISQEGQKDAIFGCISDVLHGNVRCQYDEPVDEEQEESEYDEAIIQCAGDILPRLGLALTPIEFSHYFGQICPFFIHKIEKTITKDETTDSQRAFAIGVLSECFGALKEQTQAWFNTLLPILLACVQDRNDEVRNNTIFGIGELVANAGEIAFQFFPQILNTLSHCVANEQHAGVIDNICGAISRVILANASLVPLVDVIPVYVHYLPLREDFDENLAVFKCLTLIYQQGNDVLIPLMEKIATIGLQALAKKQYSSSEAENIIRELVQQIRQSFPHQFNAAFNSDPDLALLLQQNLS